MFEMLIAKFIKIQKNSTIQILNNQEFLFHNAMLGGSYAASFKYDRRRSICNCGFDGITSQSQSRKTKTNTKCLTALDIFFTAMISSEFIDFSLGFCTKQDWKEGKREKSVFYWKNKHKHIPSQQSNYKP